MLQEDGGLQVLGRGTSKILHQRLRNWLLYSLCVAGRFGVLPSHRSPTLNVSSFAHAGNLALKLGGYRLCALQMPSRQEHSRFPQVGQKVSQYGPHSRRYRSRGSPDRVMLSAGLISNSMLASRSDWALPARMRARGRHDPMRRCWSHSLAGSGAGSWLRNSTNWIFPPRPPPSHLPPNEHREENQVQRTNSTKTQKA